MRQTRGFDLLAAGLLFLSAISWFLTLGTSAAFAYDERKFCSESGSRILLLIDVTTKFDSRSKLQLSEGVQKVLDNVKGGDHVTIATIEDSFTSSEKLFEDCVPFCLHTGPLDWLVSDCTDGLVKLKSSAMRQKIRESLAARLSRARDLPRSEILRTLSIVASDIFARGNGGNLIIYSDMIENSDFMSGKVFWATPNSELLGTIRASDLLPIFKKVNVRVFGVGRGGDRNRTPLTQTQLLKVKRFWKSYFEATKVQGVVLGEALN